MKGNEEFHRWLSETPPSRVSEVSPNYEDEFGDEEELDWKNLLQMDGEV